MFIESSVGSYANSVPGVGGQEGTSFLSWQTKDSFLIGFPLNQSIGDFFRFEHWIKEFDNQRPSLWNSA